MAWGGHCAAEDAAAGVAGTLLAPRMSGEHGTELGPPAVTVLPKLWWRGELPALEKLLCSGLCAEAAAAMGLACALTGMRWLALSALPGVWVYICGCSSGLSLEDKLRLRARFSGAGDTAAGATTVAGAAVGDATTETPDDAAADPIPRAPPATAEGENGA